MGLWGSRRGGLEARQQIGTGLGRRVGRDGAGGFGAAAGFGDGFADDADGERRALGDPRGAGEQRFGTVRQPDQAGRLVDQPRGRDGVDQGARVVGFDMGFQDNAIRDQRGAGFADARFV